MTYRLRKPLQVMRGEASKPSFVEILPREVITIDREVPDSGQVEVLHNGQSFVAVMSDIMERADVIEDE